MVEVEGSEVAVIKAAIEDHRVPAAVAVDIRVAEVEEVAAAADIRVEEAEEDLHAVAAPAEDLRVDLRQIMILCR